MFQIFSRSLKFSSHQRNWDKTGWAILQNFNLQLGAVHKLCRLRGGGGGVKNCRFYLVKRRLRAGGGGQKLPILRRHSLWTAPYSSIWQTLSWRSIMAKYWKFRSYLSAIGKNYLCHHLQAKYEHKIGHELFQDYFRPNC